MNPAEIYPHRKCPICGGLGAELLFEQRFSLLKGAALLTGYNVVVCKSCGGVFSDHLPDSKNFTKYYASASKYEFSHRGGQQHPEEINRVAGLARWLAGHIPKDNSILDVGCATGELLLRLRSEGFTDITGLDPSHECTKRARRLHGLSMIRGVLGVRKRTHRTYGAIILSAVLEHIPDINIFLKNLKSWLAPDGFLVVEVPDLEFFKNSKNAPFQELSVEHVNFFTAASLTNLLGTFGFRVVRKRNFICPAALGGITGAVLTMVGQLKGPSRTPRLERTSRTAMKEYIRVSRKTLKEEKRVIRKILGIGRPILVWGTGTLCQRLLAQGELAKNDIISFVDSNPHYQGKMLAGVQVISPEQIRSNAPILIASWGFQDEISTTIKKLLRLKNRIFTLRKVRNKARLNRKVKN
jgi:2-polyprenyl-3-methyl-5-hydroxy-6-metoxy-1,4-benzoquinol methylase